MLARREYYHRNITEGLAAESVVIFIEHLIEHALVLRGWREHNGKVVSTPPLERFAADVLKEAKQELENFWTKASTSWRDDGVLRGQYMFILCHLADLCDNHLDSSHIVVDETKIQSFTAKSERLHRRSPSAIAALLSPSIRNLQSALRLVSPPAPIDVRFPRRPGILRRRRAPRVRRPLLRRFPPLPQTLSRALRRLRRRRQTLPGRRRRPRSPSECPRADSAPATAPPPSRRRRLALSCGFRSLNRPARAHLVRPGVRTLFRRDTRHRCSLHSFTCTPIHELSIESAADVVPFVRSRRRTVESERRARTHAFRAREIRASSFASSRRGRGRVDARTHRIGIARARGGAIALHRIRRRRDASARSRSRSREVGEIIIPRDVARVGGRVRVR